MLDGPRLAARSGTATALVVLLHGYGADGRDLISLADEWGDVLPGSAFVAPDAPEPIPGYPMGRQWFGLAERSAAEMWIGVNEAAPVLESFLDAEMARHRLAPDRVALVGFSQGTMMALHVGLRRREQLAAIIAYSGRLAGPEQLGDAIVTRPPVLLVHGTEDEIIPVAAMNDAAAALLSEGVAVQCHACPHLGHGIDDAGLRLGGAFLGRHLGA